MDSIKAKELKEFMKAVEKYLVLVMPSSEVIFNLETLIQSRRFPLIIIISPSKNKPMLIEYLPGFISCVRD